jgi:hypothetical protein
MEPTAAPVSSEVSAKSYPRHTQAHPNGGLILLDEGNIMGSALKDIFGKLAKKMAKGQFGDLLKSPAPAYIHYHRTYLESCSIDMSYASLHLNKAAACEDPVERMKWVIACYVAGNHINVSQL